MTQEPTRRRLLGLLGTGATVGLAGCSGVIGGSRPDGGTPTPTPTRTASSASETTERPDTVEITEPPSGLLGVRVASPPDSSAYAVMGASDAPVTATVYGSWKCPYTQEFVLSQLGTLIRKFVKPGELKLRFRAAPYEDGEPLHGSDEPFVTRVGLAVWHRNPDAYWRYFAYAFENVQTIAGWATPERMRRLLAAAGVDSPEEIVAVARGDAHAAPIDRTMERVRSIPILRYPRIVVDGTVTAPTVDFSTTVKQIRQAIRAANAE